ncbi:conserved Plasmodium protein, unknown function [Plasmodium malariae]|uniref:Uncharacterized protein n=2 Tax=Plasmodium malariae TaxID=5858 RepID=A0A1D3PC20_PLAMA|nr:conserved Plasmodium protein, unknown function [Plasmodium malariae]SCN12856.1 conserved Plasmodium protein, unknown function [Plasmodium malariae]
MSIIVALVMCSLLFLCKSDDLTSKNSENLLNKSLIDILNYNFSVNDVMGIFENIFKNSVDDFKIEEENHEIKNLQFKKYNFDQHNYNFMYTSFTDYCLKEVTSDKCYEYLNKDHMTNIFKNVNHKFYSRFSKEINELRYYTFEIEKLLKRKDDLNDKILRTFDEIKNSKSSLTKAMTKKSGKTLPIIKYFEEMSYNLKHANKSLSFYDMVIQYGNDLNCIIKGALVEYIYLYKQTKNYQKKLEKYIEKNARVLSKMHKKIILSIFYMISDMNKTNEKIDNIINKKVNEFNEWVSYENYNYVKKLKILKSNVDFNLDDINELIDNSKEKLEKNKIAFVNMSKYLSFQNPSKTIMSIIHFLNNKYSKDVNIFFIYNEEYMNFNFDQEKKKIKPCKINIDTKSTNNFNFVHLDFMETSKYENLLNSITNEQNDLKHVDRQKIENIVNEIFHPDEQGEDNNWIKEKEFEDAKSKISYSNLNEEVKLYTSKMEKSIDDTINDYYFFKPTIKRYIQSVRTLLRNAIFNFNKYIYSFEKNFTIHVSDSYRDSSLATDRGDKAPSDRQHDSKERNKKPQLGSELGVELNAGLNSELSDELGGELESELESELGSELIGELGEELGGEVGADVTEGVEKEAEDGAKETENSSENISNNRVENEVKNEAKNEVKNEAKNEIKSEAKNEVKNEAKNEIKSEAKNGTESKSNNQGKNIHDEDKKGESKNKDKFENNKDSEQYNEQDDEQSSGGDGERNNVDDNEESSENDNEESSENDNEQSSEDDNEQSSEDDNEQSSEDDNEQSSEDDNEQSSEDDNEQSSEDDNEQSSEDDNEQSSEDDNEQSSEDDNEENDADDNDCAYENNDAEKCGCGSNEKTTSSMSIFQSGTLKYLWRIPFINNLYNMWNKHKNKRANKKEVEDIDIYEVDKEEMEKIFTNFSNLNYEDSIKKIKENIFYALPDIEYILNVLRIYKENKEKNKDKNFFYDAFYGNDYIIIKSKGVHVETFIYPYFETLNLQLNEVETCSSKDYYTCMKKYVRDNIKKELINEKIVFVYLGIFKDEVFKLPKFKIVDDLKKAHLKQFLENPYEHNFLNNFFVKKYEEEYIFFQKLRIFTLYHSKYKNSNIYGIDFNFYVSYFSDADLEYLPLSYYHDSIIYFKVILATSKYGYQEIVPVDDEIIKFGLMLSLDNKNKNVHYLILSDVINDTDYNLVKSKTGVVKICEISYKKFKIKLINEKYKVQVTRNMKIILQKEVTFNNSKKRTLDYVDTFYDKMNKIMKNNMNLELFGKTFFVHLQRI